MLYRLTISYRGEAYAGWQRQSNALGVQEVVEEAIGRLAGKKVHVVGASRTDAGVHALGQVVHSDLSSELGARALVHGSNQYLPDDVRILRAMQAAPGFHARRDAVAKEYWYRLSFAEVMTPLESPFTVAAPRDLNVELLAAAASLVEGRHDFTAFAKSKGAHTHPFRLVHRARFEVEGTRLTFKIVGDGFLRGMVRGLVGTLLEIGADKRSLKNFRELLKGRPRSEAGPNAKARGLVLREIFYADNRPLSW